MIKQRKIICFFMIFTIITTAIDYVYADNLNINSPSAILIESETGKILYQKNINMPRAIASTSKIMTYLLVMEAIEEGKINLDDKVQISRNAAYTRGSSYYLNVNEVLTVEELLNSMMIISANDSAVALAEHVSGSVENFCTEMNNKAKKLGLKNAHFVNPNGLPLANNTQNKMTAYEMALLSKYIINKYGERLFEITGQKKFRGTYKTFNRENTNKLLEREAYIDGLKTGYTGLAGYCLVATAKVEGSNQNRFISVILGGKSSEQRFNDSKKLIEYGLNNFNEQIVMRKGEILGYTQILSDRYIPIELIAKDTIWVFSPKNLEIAKNKELLFNDDNYDENILTNEQIPSILRLNDGTEIEIPLIATRGVSVFVNNSQILFEDVAPFINNNITFVPLRKLAEFINLEIEWNEYTRTITCKSDDSTFVLTVDSKMATVNGECVELDEPVIIVQGNVMAPARFIAESLEMKVEWDNDTRSLEIYSNNNLRKEEITLKVALLFFIKLFNSYIMGLI